MEEHLKSLIVSVGYHAEKCSESASQFYKEASVENLECLTDEALIELTGALVVAEKKVRDLFNVMRLKNL